MILQTPEQVAGGVLVVIIILIMSAWARADLISREKKSKKNISPQKKLRRGWDD